MKPPWADVACGTSSPSGPFVSGGLNFDGQFNLLSSVPKTIIIRSIVKIRNNFKPLRPSFLDEPRQATEAEGSMSRRPKSCRHGAPKNISPSARVSAIRPRRAISCVVPKSGRDLGGKREIASTTPP